MSLRDVLLNLAITAALLVVILMAALLVRTGSGQRQGTVEGGGETSVEPVAKPRLEQFERIERAELVDVRSNEADTLRFRVGQEEHVFVLYFVDALEAAWTHPQLISDQARWFGNVSSEDVVETGIEARDYVRELLTSKPFEIRTRWERVPNTLRYYALVVVEHQPGRSVYLADLLIRKGYARPGGLTTTLPDDPRDINEYLRELRNLATAARNERAGIWSRTPDSFFESPP
jgi:endonuclease YncB( thermonuclease family)